MKPLGMFSSNKGQASIDLIVAIGIVLLIAAVIIAVLVAFANGKAESLDSMWPF